MVMDKLWEHFNDRQKSTRESLEKLMEGEPIAKDNFYNVSCLIIDLGSKYVVAKRMGEAGYFSLKSIYINLMRAKLPHLINEWTREFKGGWREPERELTFDAFEEFILRVARIDEEISKNTWGLQTLESTSQSEDQDPRDVSTPVRSRSDSDLEEVVSGEDTDRPSLPVTGQRRTTRSGAALSVDIRTC
jgi:hypothetical protein